MKNFGILIMVFALIGCQSAGKKTDDKTTESANVDVKKYSEGLKNVNLQAQAQQSCLPSQISSLNWQGLVNMGHACVKDGDWKNVENVANQISRIEMNSPWAAYYLSLHAEHEKDLTRALWMIEQSLKKSQGQIGLLHYQKGRLLLQLKQINQGFESITKGVELDGALAEGHVFLAQSYYRDQEWDKAASHFEAVLRTDDKNLVALQGLAQVRVIQEKPEAASEALEAWLVVQPSVLWARVKLAQLYETQLKKPEKALPLYRGLKEDLEKGRLKDKPDVDVVAKVTNLETLLKKEIERKQTSVEEPKTTDKKPKQGGQK